MEIYVDDTVSPIEFNSRPIPDLTAVTATVDNDTQVIVATNNVGLWSLMLPYKYVQYGGSREINWTYLVAGVEYKRPSRVEVVTPLLNLDIVKTIAEPKTLTDQEASFLEKKVRYVIESYTGRSFGAVQGTMHFKVSDYPYSTEIPIIEAASVSYMFSPNQIVSYYDPKSDVIFYPSSISRSNYIAVTGVFGYMPVPQDIEEAAKILLADYACADGGYRDRYIGTISVADWRLQFRGAAFTGTGNAVVDDILSKYKIFPAMVI